jgi:hypothetical protein
MDRRRRGASSRRGLARTIATTHTGPAVITEPSLLPVRGTDHGSFWDMFSAGTNHPKGIGLRAHGAI